MSRYPTDVLARIKAKTTTNAAGCWVFAGAHAAGYPQIWWNRRQHLAHRVTYELLVGPIPDGLQVDHLCRNKSCVNPAHLEPVTPRENQERAGMKVAARQLAKTHCPERHPYDKANTYVTPQGHRQCRTCNRRRAAAASSARRAA